MIFILLLLSILSALCSADPLFTFCSFEKNYTPHGSFENNLKRLIDALSANIVKYSLPGFYNTSIEDNHEGVNGQALCRGDVGSAVCRNCIQDAGQHILNSCKSEDALIWYELCQVRYSFQMFFSLMTYTAKYPPYNDLKKNVSDPAKFDKVLTYLMQNLSEEAAFNPSKNMFATGKIEFSKEETIYGLLQCTRDISRGHCDVCLQSASTELSKCCNFRQGGIVLSRNCNVRFELNRFYNDTSNTLSLTYPFSNGDKWETWKVVVVTCISVLLLVIVIFSCVVYLRPEKGTEKVDRGEEALLQELASHTAVTITEEGNLVTSEELPFIDLATIKAATDDFADSNKLGQGGFGSVYKGI